jgi:hypothetical protein
MRPSPPVIAGSERCTSRASSDVRVARTKESSPSPETSTIDLDDLSLHLTIERDRDVTGAPVVAYADQRILFGKLT